MDSAAQPCDDLRGDGAEADEPTTADMIAAIDRRIERLSSSIEFRLPGWETLHAIDKRDRWIFRAIREVIIDAAPAICRACGELNPWWLLAGGTSVPCWGCGARHLATPPQNSAALPPADRATGQLPAAVGRATGGREG